MIRTLDMPRFNFCLQTGRRFYVACKLFEKYTELLGGSDSISLNGVSGLTRNRNFREDVRISYSDDRDLFEPYDEDYIDPKGLPPTEAYEFFCMFDYELYMNLYTNVNYYQFSMNYRNIYSLPVRKLFYTATSCIIPIEVNIKNFSIKCNYKFSSGNPDEERLPLFKRLPLIDCLYRSDEMIDFVNKLISAMMFSTHLYYLVYANFGREQVRSETNFSEGFKKFNETWKSKILNLRKCFSLSNSMEC